MLKPPRALRAQSSQAGSSTAEFALLLPAVIFLLALILGALATGIAQFRLEEASRLGARAAARGDSAQEVLALVQEIEPAAQVSLEEEGPYLLVRASRPAPGLIGQISGWTLVASARAPREGGG